jgi:hypothetical protein
MGLHAWLHGLLQNALVGVATAVLFLCQNVTPLLLLQGLLAAATRCGTPMPNRDTPGENHLMHALLKARVVLQVRLSAMNIVGC